MRLGYSDFNTHYGGYYPSFNEAEAHAPRIRLAEVFVRHYGFAASMRPRRMRLGYARAEETTILPKSSFNEAEAHAPRIQSVV